MNIVVCVKQVPDSAARLAVDNGRVTWGDAPLVLNPWDEFAVEAALVQKEAAGGQVTVISRGDESAKEALKTALAMGCEQAILVSDPALSGLDSQAVAITRGHSRQPDIGMSPQVAGLVVVVQSRPSTILSVSERIVCS